MVLPYRGVCMAEGHWIALCMLLALFSVIVFYYPLRWCHNGRGGVSNHGRLDCLPNRLFRRRSKKASKLRGEFPSQRASNAENVPIWWRHHDRRRAIASFIGTYCQWHAGMEFPGRRIYLLKINEHISRTAAILPASITPYEVYY